MPTSDLGSCRDGRGAVAQLERRLRDHYGMRYALCVSSATTGLAKKLDAEPESELRSRLGDDVRPPLSPYVRDSDDAGAKAVPFDLSL